MQLRTAIRTGLWAGLLLFPITMPAQADRVVTVDGRQLTATKARKNGEGYILEFPHGSVELQDGSLVKAVEMEGDMSDYVPADDRERDFLEKGYVRYRGKWMSKRGYEAELKRETTKSREAADEAASYSKWKDALELESKYFHVRSNTSPELLKFYADLLDAYYGMMNKRIGIKPTPMMRGVKLQVNIYKSHKEFTEITGSDPNVLGFFMPSGKSANLNFFHDYEEPEAGQWVGLHECTHLLTYLIDQQFRPKIWINEAMADYLGSSEITLNKRGKISIRTGVLQTDRVLTVQQAIKDENFVHLKDLFNLDKAQFQGFQYAHAWSFVYFLNNGAKGKYVKGFGKFFSDLYKLKGVEYKNIPSYGGSQMGKEVAPNDIRDFLLKKIKVKDLDQLEKDWIAFIKAVPIDGPKAKLKRGLRATAWGKFDEALPDLDAAIEGGIADPRAFAARARANSFEGKMKKSVKDMQSAIALDPLNAKYYFDQSHYLLGSFSYIGVEDTEDYFEMIKKKSKKGLAAAIQAAGLAMDLNPDVQGYESWYFALGGQ